MSAVGLTATVTSQTPDPLLGMTSSGDRSRTV